MYFEQNNIKLFRCARNSDFDTITQFKDVKYFKKKFLSIPFNFFSHQRKNNKIELNS